MGVPITFLNKFNPEQFEILGITDRQKDHPIKCKIYTKEDNVKYSDMNARSVILQSGVYKCTYPRILIKRKT